MDIPKINSMLIYKRIILVDEIKKIYGGTHGSSKQSFYS